VQDLGGTVRLNAQAAVQIAYEILSVLAPLFCRSVRTDIHPLQRLGIFTASAAMRLIRTLDKIDERLAEHHRRAVRCRISKSVCGHRSCYTGSAFRSYRITR
jgi:hypothetical protein